MDSYSISYWMIIVNSACPNFGSIVGVSDVNLKTHISAPGNTSEEGGEKSITAPHQSRYPPKDNLILIGHRLIC
jgi:hypothetical protein